MDDRDIASLPLPPTSLALLARAGYATAGDLDGVSAPELADDLGLEVGKAAALLAAVRCGGESAPLAVGGRSAIDLLNEDRKATRLVTFVPALDQLLGGGVQVRQLTEFAGPPGVGKTQLATQLALNVQIPVMCGGLEGEAVYVDTEGSFMAARANEMATHLVAHLQRTAERDQNPALVEATRTLQAARLLERIHYFRVHDATEQLAAVRSLRDFVSARPAVRVRRTVSIRGRTSVVWAPCPRALCIAGAHPDVPGPAPTLAASRRRLRRLPLPPRGRYGEIWGRARGGARPRAAAADARRDDAGDGR